MSRIVDLSVAIENAMPAHKNFPAPIVLPFADHAGTRALGFGTADDPFTSSILYLSMLEHVGTHIDAFFHMNPDGATVDEMPIDMFFGKAITLDLRHIPDLGDIDVPDMEAAEEKAGITIDGHIVLLCTGFHRRHYPKQSSMHRNPGITAAATHWLADRGVLLHGVEGPSTDKPTDPTFPNHRVCRDRGITHYEWLCNLEELVGAGEFEFQGIPLNIKGGTGSPVRALAFID